MTNRRPLNGPSCHSTPIWAVHLPWRKIGDSMRLLAMLGMVVFVVVFMVALLFSLARLEAILFSFK